MWGGGVGSRHVAKVGLSYKWSKPVLTTKRFKSGLSRSKLDLSRSKVVKTHTPYVRQIILAHSS